MIVPLRANSLGEASSTLGRGKMIATEIASASITRCHPHGLGAGWRCSAICTAFPHELAGVGWGDSR